MIAMTRVEGRIICRVLPNHATQYDAGPKRSSQLDLCKLSICIMLDAFPCNFQPTAIYHHDCRGLVETRLPLRRQADREARSLSGFAFADDLPMMCFDDAADGWQAEAAATGAG